MLDARLTILVASSQAPARSPSAAFTVGSATGKISWRLPAILIVVDHHVRSWIAAHPTTPQPLCDAVRGVLRDLITDVQAAYNHNPRTDPVGVILQQATRSTRDNERPPPPPHLRI